MIDEGPSRQDIERFSREETAYCPDCGKEVWEQAEVCPHCYAYLGGDPVTKKPVQRWFTRKWTILLILALIAAFMAIFMRSLPAGF